MKITAITPQKRNKNFYNIHIDDEYYCSLDDESIYYMKLKVGVEVDSELLRKASEEASYKKALNYSLNLFAKYQKTKHELIKKLREKEYNDDTINKVVKKMEDLGFLNDEQYAESFIRNKQGTNQGLNKRTLYNKLLQKGIPKELILLNLENSDIDEYQNAMEAAEKKLRSLKGDIKQKKSKLYAFLQYKGFSYEVCTKVVNNIDLSE